MKSMTGYGKLVETVGEYEISVEVKTLNSKHLNIALSYPSYLNSCELCLHELVGRYIKRGKVSVKVRIRFLKPPEAIKVDFGLASAYYHALDDLSSSLGIPEPVKLEDLLRFKEIVRFEMSEEEIQRICEAGSSVLEKVLQKVVEERRKEGEKLREMLKGFLDSMKEKLHFIESKADGMVEYYAEKLREGVKNLLPADAVLDQSVLETAIAVLAEKADIREEIDRLKSHLKRAYELIEDDGCVGPNLDFLAQELLREFNTILSKSKITDISSAAIEGKLLVNSFREQVQNIE